MDLPGYGYAKVSKKELSRWADLIEGYFNEERDIALAMALVDIRHSPSSQDRLMVSFLQEVGFPYAIVFTKADKLGKQRALRNRRAIADELKVPASTPILLTSSMKGTEIYQLRKVIADHVEKR